MSLAPRIFNDPQAVVRGWYWVCRSREIRTGQVRAVRLLGRDLAVFRGTDGKLAAFDAYCAHMGAHLAEGRVEGNALRCFFHHWKYEADGRCSEVPCLEGPPTERMRVKAWPLEERYGMAWLWTGEAAEHPVPEVPDLAGQRVDAHVANRFAKKCHPNVVLINAIDEQHFRSVHHLPGSILRMEALPRTVANIEFHNTGHMPRQHWLGRLLARFYAGALTYKLSYWYGSGGFVTFGPDFLRLHLMFTLRRSDDGGTEGQTIALTRHRPGIAGAIANALILRVTSLAARYFAHGDTRVFQTIRFRFLNPIAADRAVLEFIRHLEAQPLAQWAQDPEEHPAPRPFPVRVETRGKTAHGS
jgi:phenylpropionate dioxygenase-like ring-hydroxylating dioxygenase large terminal subunit